MPVIYSARQISGAHARSSVDATIGSMRTLE